MATPVTIYEKELARIIDERYGKLPAGRLFAELCRTGVVDHTRCKILAIRRWVEGIVADGRCKKIDAMWLAAEYFCVTYEYVRKCMYYYTDVNI